jgi:hypothetical protein
MNNCFPSLAKIISLTLFAVILSSCATTKKELPKTSHDGLDLVEDTTLGAVYKKPGADFSQYDRVAIVEVTVAFRKNWQRDQNRDRMGLGRSVSNDDMDRIKKTLSEEFKKVFSKELQEGGYKITESGAEDVLVLRPAIIDLDITAPDTMSPGMTRTFTASAGEMTLYMELYDSVSSEILGRVVDAEAGRDLGGIRISNRVTNVAEADRILRKWADILRKKLDQAHGKEAKQ